MQEKMTSTTTKMPSSLKNHSLTSPRKKHVHFKAGAALVICDKKVATTTKGGRVKRKLIYFDNKKCTITSAKRLYERVHQSGVTQMNQYRKHLETCAICRLVCGKCYARAEARQRKYEKSSYATTKKEERARQLAAVALFDLAMGARVQYQ